MSWRNPHDNDCAKLELPGLKEPLYLERECWCKDKKTPRGAWPYKDGVCSLCKDTGYEPTEAGKTILEFLKRHT